MAVLHTKLLSSLSKVFADEPVKDSEFTSGSMLSNERYSFQIAYHWDGYFQKGVSLKVTSDIEKFITIQSVNLSPSDMPCYVDHDDNILRSTPGLYPDIIENISSSGLTILTNQWRSLWVTVNGDKDIITGNHNIKIDFVLHDGNVIGTVNFNLNVIPATLPKQTLINTNWFHSDCIATWYKVDVFSESHWDLLRKYIKTAVDNGMNMILTPLFTPPLDTIVGGERPTVQLVDVFKDGSNFTFKFDKLERWVNMCLEVGIEYFEMSHLFTQWGANHAPKIVGYENGDFKKLFGWETNAKGDEYAYFLSQFLPSLVNFINKKGIDKQCYFHVSDEPGLWDLESYQYCSSLLNKYIEGFPVIDALSNYEFYEKGLVKNPIPGSNHIDPFIKNDVPNLWTYYCCAQYHEVANRFFNMPSARNRILGIQLYKYNIIGFLHWGYNFWYSQFSISEIDPYRVTDAGCGFPSGDAFVVYPGKDAPVESLRLKVFYESLQDLRALKLLESLIGRQAVLDMLDEGLDTPITFKKYPKDMEWLLNKREQINKLISLHSI